MNNDDKILKMLEELQAGQKNLTKTVDDLQRGQDRLEKKVETTDMKVENFHEYQKKANEEIMSALFESNESNGEQLAEHKERIEALEDHTGLIKPHKN